MHSSSFTTDSISDGIVAGRVPEAARIVLCVADSAIREPFARIAAECAVLEIASSLDRVIPQLSRQAAAIIVVDEASLTQASFDGGSRSLRELANAVAHNPGGAQLLFLSARGSLTNITNGVRSDDLIGRVTVLNPQGLSNDTIRTLFGLMIRQSETQSQPVIAAAHAPSHALCEVLGASPGMQRLFAAVDEAAESDQPILLCGEPGTGTGLIANAIHDGASRCNQSFVRIHSRALTLETLNDLLCIDRGGAESPTVPIDTPAYPIGGTLFLDDLDTFPVALQKSLCRFIDRQREMSEGSQGHHRATVRVIASTHLNLDLPNRQTLSLEILSRGIDAQRLFIPSLRDRPEDIGPLCEQFFVRWAMQEDQPKPRLTRNALECLKEHLWPGNVRELYTVLRNTAILAVSGDITADMLQPWLAMSLEIATDEAPKMTLADMERQLIETTFSRCGGNREKTAASLDIGLRTLSGKLREYGYPPRGGPGSNLKAA